MKGPIKALMINLSNFFKIILCFLDFLLCFVHPGLSGLPKTAKLAVSDEVMHGNFCYLTFYLKKSNLQG